MTVRFTPGLAMVAGMVVMAGQAHAEHHRAQHRSHGTAHSRYATLADDSDTNFTYGGSDWKQRGTASYYGVGRLSRRTASGAVFDSGAMTAAHAFLPFGTRVVVRDEESGREVTVTITDRLPTPSRVIDLSVGAARELGILHRGLTHVSLAQAT